MGEAEAFCFSSEERGNTVDTREATQQGEEERIAVSRGTLVVNVVDRGGRDMWE